HAAAEAARGAKPDAGLFLLTFSRKTLPTDARPHTGEEFAFSSWNREPQCFLTEVQLVEELAGVGFVRDRPGPLTEYNVREPAARGPGGPPAIYEGTFMRRSVSSARRGP